MKRFRKLQFIGLLTGVTLLFGAGLWGVIQANENTNGYLHDLYAGASNLDPALEQLAKTADLPVFYDPGNSGTQNLENLATTLRSIRIMRAELRQFEKTAQSLEPFNYASLFSAYHDARVQQGHALDIVKQTTDVLNQYESLVNFLTLYYNIDITFETLTARVNAVSNLDSLAPQVSQLYADQRTLSDLATRVGTPETPDSFKSLTTQSGAVYRQAAQGFGTLAYGLSVNSDPLKSAGIVAIEQATNAHDSLQTSLAAGNAQNSYILAQVGQLPNKTSSIIFAKSSGD